MGYNETGSPHGDPVSGGGSLSRGRAVIAFAALHLFQDDSVQQHGQLGGADLNAGRSLASHRREAKDSLFESFIPQAITVLLPGQDLEPIASAIAKDEPVP